MSIFMTLRIAVKALNRNKMRTILTMLGMIIGVGAVITMVALGRGAQATIEEQIKSAGTNLININAGNFQSAGVRQGAGMATTLTAEDATSLRQVPGVQYVAAGVNSRGQVIAGNQNWSTQVQGTDVDLPAHPQLADQVRHVLHAERRQHGAPRSPCSARWSPTTLFGPEVDPTGQIIRIRNQPFKVIGVMTSKGQGPFGAGSGRHHLHAVHHGPEEAAGHSAHQQHHRVVARPRTRPQSPKRSASRCAPGTSCCRANPTTSWCARRKRSPASAPRRRGR